MRCMITKRYLGMGFIILGLGGDLALLVIGRLGMGNWGGIGPLEGAMLIAGMCIALAGVPLLSKRGMPVVNPETSSGITSNRQEEELNKIKVNQEQRWVKWVGWVLSGLALLIFLGYLTVYVAYAVELFRWPYDYDQGESFELYDAVLHSQGAWPYRDGSRYPFYASNYPPFFHLLIIPLFPLLGQTLLAGRVLSFVVTLATGGIIGWSVHQRTKGWYLPLMCGLGYIASNFVYHIGPLCRQHLTMVFLETLCVYFIAGAADKLHGFRNTLIGLLCLLLAGYTKQLSVFTAGAVFGYLFLLNPKRCLVLVSGFGLVFGLIFLGLNWATDGQWWLNTISANVNAYLMPQLIALVRAWFKLHPVFLLLALGFVIYELYFDHVSVHSLWFMTAIGTGLMSGKWGAGEAYWVTSIAAALILSGFAINKLHSWAQRQSAKAEWGVTLLLPLLFIFQGTRMVHLPTSGPLWGTVARVLGVEGVSVYADYAYYDTIGYTQVGHFMLPRDYAGGERIMAYVRETDKPIFSEEAAFSMLAGKRVVTNPTQLLNLYNNGLLDTHELESMIRQEAFGLVIMRAQFYPPPVLAAIGQHYGLVEHIPMNGFQYIVMRPLGKPEVP